MHLPGEQVIVICDGEQQTATVTSISDDTEIYTVQLDATGELIDVDRRFVAAKA